ncbi:sodium channel protein Nach-like isoform X2 [Coccinella septempunctata]|uniref:sodium channel protein Nach-like isoform X2 n=1 Tax=Coccinella septempunctata TaxID=41139 RepID=UPI001D07124F|nr:sodium channel protein Nach-like isoform X2 [Coccinella septempunctata]
MIDDPTWTPGVMRKRVSVGSQTSNVGRLNFVVVRAVQEAFRQFSKSSSLCGYRYLTEGSALERFIWLLIHLTSLSSVIYLNLYMWQMFITDPTIVTLEKFTLPIREVPFPGVSICNINRISKKAAYAMAKEYADRSSENLSYIFEDIKFLGKLYDFSFSDQEEESIMRFQKFLEEYDPDRPQESLKGDFDVLNKMSQLQLAGDCVEMLSDCRWGGFNRPCADLFINELTMDGFCCVFNYFNKNNPNVSKIMQENDNRTLHSTKFGRNFGLTFRVNTNISDYFYSPIATMGSKILITSAEDFPDTTSGSLIEKLVPIGVEANLELTAQSIYTVYEAKKYSIAKRNCIFKNEVRTIFGDYSQSDCIMDCKIRSVAALCECVSFMHTKAAFSGFGYQCTLADLACLSKYAAKWRQIYPRDYADDGLEREKQDALNCRNCYPECDTSRYFVNSEQGNIAGDDLNYSIVNIFFETPYVEQHKQDVVYYWFDMISMFGGICSLIMGISIISCVEVVIFFTYKIIENIYKFSR